MVLGRKPDKQNCHRNIRIDKYAMGVLLLRKPVTTKSVQTLPLIVSGMNGKMEGAPTHAVQVLEKRLEQRKFRRRLVVLVREILSWRNHVILMTALLQS